MNNFDSSLQKNEANYTPLNPITFLKKTAATFPNKKSLIYNSKSFIWSETYNRCKQLASALRLRGLDHGDVIGFLALNTPELYEAHFGVPMAGMILNAMNYRLDAKTLAFIIDHSETKLLVAELLLDCLLAHQTNFKKYLSQRHQKRHTTSIPSIMVR